MKDTIIKVGSAMYYLKTLKKYKEEYKKYPNVFKLRAKISDEVLEIPINDNIKAEIEKYFEENIKKNQKILDDNSDTVEFINSQ